MWIYENAEPPECALMRFKCREFGVLAAIERSKQISADLYEYKTASMRINSLFVPVIQDVFSLPAIRVKLLKRLCNS